MDQYTSKLEEMLASLEDLSERFDEDGIDNYDEIMDALEDIESEFSILLEICGPINGYGLLLHQIQTLINRLRKSMEDIDTEEAETEEMLYDELIFNTIARHAARKLELDGADEDDILLLNVIIDCEVKGLKEDAAVHYIICKLMGMGYYISEDDVKCTLSDVKTYCQSEIMAYKIALDEIYNYSTDPEIVFIKVNDFLNNI